MKIQEYLFGELFLFYKTTSEKVFYTRYLLKIILRSLLPLKLDVNLPILLLLLSTKNVWRSVLHWRGIARLDYDWFTCCDWVLQDFMIAWGGISSLQFGLSLFWSQAKTRGLNLTDVNRLLTLQPARLAGSKRTYNSCYGATLSWQLAIAYRYADLTAVKGLPSPDGYI